MSDADAQLLKIIFVRLAALLEAPAIVTGPLDYFPNATLVRYTLSTQDGTVIATGEFRARPA